MVEAEAEEMIETEIPQETEDQEVETDNGISYISHIFKIKIIFSSYLVN